MSVKCCLDGLQLGLEIRTDRVRIPILWDVLAKVCIEIIRDKRAFKVESADGSCPSFECSSCREGRAGLGGAERQYGTSGENVHIEQNGRLCQSLRV